MHIMLAVSAARLLGTGVAWFPKATISASVNVKSHKCRFSSWYAATLALVTSAAPFCNTNFNAICAALLLCAYDVITSELIPKPHSDSGQHTHTGVCDRPPRGPSTASAVACSSAIYAGMTVVCTFAASATGPVVSDGS